MLFIQLIAYVCWCVRQTVTTSEPISNPEYPFETIWRFIYRFGSVFLQIDKAPMMEVRTGFTKKGAGVEKIIRFMAEEREVSRVCPCCWGHDRSCDGKDIRILHDTLIKYIETIYIE